MCVCVSLFRSQNTDLQNEGYILELDCCSSLEHLTGQKIIPEFIKKVSVAVGTPLKGVAESSPECPGWGLPAGRWAALHRPALPWTLGDPKEGGPLPLRLALTLEQGGFPSSQDGRPCLLGLESC